MPEVKSIVIIGPESTGKSTLCKQLAEHYNTLWCPEFAREYLMKHGTAYTYDDLLEIAKGQLKLEDEYLEKVRGQKFEIRSKKYEIQNLETNYKPQTTNHKLLFIDTNMYVMKVWCEFVFEKCHQFILDEIATRKYDLYLSMNIDLPWTKDELREYPDLETREKLYHIYKDILINQHVPWKEISGTDDERSQQAIAAIESSF